MAIRLRVQDNTTRLRIREEDSARLRANEGFPIYENDYNDLAHKPQINGVTLEGDLSTEDLHIQAGVTSWNGQTGDVTYTAPVTSVNGQTGAVNLSIPTVPTNVSAFTNDAGYITSAEAPVQSVNGQTGNVSLSIPSKTSDLTNDSGYITGISGSDVTSALGYTPYNASNPSGYVNAAGAASAAPVQSVNGQTGSVTISVPSKTSDLTNDSGYITGINSSDVTTALGYTPYNSTNPSGYVNASGAAAAAPVQSVNGKTGTVSLDASDVSALPASTVYAQGVAAGGNAVRTNGILYGEVDSTSTSTVFTATIPGITELYDGLTIFLRNGVVTSASGFTININNLGAKGVYNNQGTGNPTTPTAPTRETSIFNINYTMMFIYSEDLVDGGAWIVLRGYNSDTNTIAYQLRTNSYSLPMDSVTYRYRLLFSSADNTKWVPATNSSSTNATSSRTVVQTKINPFGSIVYYGHTSSIAAGSRPGATYLWEQYPIALGYSFNRTGAALTLTSWKPVYLKCAPQTDGTAIMDADAPIVQDLPSTADGKIYIFLGVAYSATNIELNVHHPVYEYKDGHVRLWSNSYVPTKVSELTNDSGYLTLSTLPIYDGSVV